MKGTSGHWILAVVVPMLGGCCWMSKRSCFPACPKPEAAKVVTVEKACELPPLELPAFKQAAVCPEDHVCFDRENGAQLYVRLARLKDFAKMARARCTVPPPASQPASQPIR